VCAEENIYTSEKFSKRIMEEKKKLINVELHNLNSSPNITKTDRHGK
jgi:hypothetical protein